MGPHHVVLRVDVADSMELRPLTRDNYTEVAEIYSQGIATGIATFQNEAPAWEAWDAGHLPFCRIGAYHQGRMLGWVALTPVSWRPVYAGVAEVSIYVAQHARGRGTGTRLLDALITDSEAHGIWMLQSGIFTENQPSIHLHVKCGFRMVGYREKIGKKNGVWKDNVLMERRSRHTGIN